MSDLFFLYFVPLCFLVPICFFLVWFLLTKRKKVRTSPGSALGPAHTNPILKDIASCLFDEIGLPSQEFRRELGVKYPDLAMAFRQSVNFGLIRYTREFWNSEPDASLRISIINRLLCDYYGLVIPRQPTLQQLKDAFAVFFKQKKILYKVNLEPATGLTITDKDQQALFTLATAPVEEADLLKVLKNWANAVQPNSGAELHWFRAVDGEYGFVLATPQEYQGRLRAYEQILSVPVESK
jgi:hypothetical protein